MRKLFIPIAGLLPLTACGSVLTCPESTTLEALVMCVRMQMPQSGSEGYVAPTSAQRDDWRTVVTEMMKGSCDFPVPGSLFGIAQVRTFTDSGNGRSYCLLMEVQDQNNNGAIDKGFGTFIVYNKATRQLSHQAVHPIADSTTEIQAVTLFKETDSRSFLMAGAHRDANAAVSACITKPPHPVSDPSHNSDTMVQATNEALLAFYGEAPWFAIQWHGMTVARCPNTDVYPSHGVDMMPAPTDKIMILQGHLAKVNPKWDVDLPGSNSCTLNATDNVQGRLLNGIPAADVCGPDAKTYTQRFLHIEQDPNFRNPKDWIAPITSTFP